MTLMTKMHENEKRIKNNSFSNYLHVLIHSMFVNGLFKSTLTSWKGALRYTRTIRIVYMSAASIVALPISRPQLKCRISSVGKKLTRSVNAWICIFF